MPDGAIVQQARTAAGDILDTDPDLSAPADSGLAAALAQASSRVIDWSRIS